MLTLTIVWFSSLSKLGQLFFNHHWSPPGDTDWHQNIGSYSRRRFLFNPPSSSRLCFKNWLEGHRFPDLRNLNFSLMEANIDPTSSINNTTDVVKTAALVESAGTMIQTQISQIPTPIPRSARNGVIWDLDLSSGLIKAVK